MALCHSQVTLLLSADINITETTYSLISLHHRCCGQVTRMEE